MKNGDRGDGWVYDPWGNLGPSDNFWKTSPKNYPWFHKDSPTSRVASDRVPPQKPLNRKETTPAVNPDWVVDCAEELVNKIGCSGSAMQIANCEEMAQAIIKRHAPPHSLP